MLDTEYSTKSMFQIPSTALSRVRANLAVLRHLGDIDNGAASESEVLSAWSGWGSCPQVFDDSSDVWRSEAAELAELLSAEEYSSAKASTLNAHFTPPRIVDAVWDLARGLGFEGGSVLEPGCGAGVFLAGTDRDWDVVGVESDPITARVAQLLNPHAVVHASPFEDLRLSEGSVDLAIGNVPFGDYPIMDRVYNSDHRLRVHNYFINKSLHLLRPGGLALLLTSRHTLDARSVGFRESVARMADLVGVIRFPTGAFASTSGTSVVVDLLVLRRLDSGNKADLDGQWIKSQDWPRDEQRRVYQPESVNTVFDTDNASTNATVLGAISTGRGMYRDNEIMVEADSGDMLAGLDAAVDAIIGHAQRVGREFAAVVDPAVVISVETGEEPEGRWRIADGVIQRVRNGSYEPETSRTGTVLTTASKSKTGRELAALIGLRDTARVLLETQTSSPDAELGTQQKALKDAYWAYRNNFGPINRVTLSEGAVDADTGVAKIVRRRPNLAGFRSDPDYHLVTALESYDETSGEVSLAAIFDQRVIAVADADIEVTGPADAVAVCLDRHGKLDSDIIAALADIAVVDVGEYLHGRAFTDPLSGELHTAEKYLAGDVRVKLGEALTAAGNDSRFDANVAALQAAQPADLGPEQIEGRLGAPWIPASDIIDFMASIDCGRGHVEHLAAAGTWIVENSWAPVTARTDFGTSDMDAWKLLSKIMNSQPVEVHVDEWSPQKGAWVKTRDTDRTLAAVNKAEKLSKEFSLWLWVNPDRTRRLLEVYNTRFNSVVLADWNGSHLTFPGMSPAWKMRPHQANAVWRALSEPAVLFAHLVGAGKTAAMAATAMEARRLGKANKPLQVVPNHLIEQTARDVLRVYPNARLLVADKKDMDSVQGRQSFVAKAAVGDWDLILMTHSAFTRIPTLPETKSGHVAEQIARHTCDVRTAGHHASIKRIEAKIKRLRAKHQVLLAEHLKDEGVAFEYMGVDLVIIDEAQSFKNLGLVTGNRSVSSKPSQRAEDLMMKLNWVRARYGNGPIFATGTPVTNTLAEVYVNLRYLIPERLDAIGLTTLDMWLTTFAQTVTALELAPEGKRMRVHTRIAKFQNVPELITLFAEAADIQLDADKLGLVRPNKTEHIVTVECPNEVSYYINDLVSRADAIRSRAVTPEEDNMLKVCNDGRKAALDPHLVGLDVDTKLPAVSERVAAAYQATTGDMFDDAETGAPHSTPGGFQVVFCDLGVNGETSTYTRLRSQLITAGVNPSHIEIAQDSKTASAKAGLHARCRNGTTRILIASTAACGLGTNIATRLTAIHHLDCPWRPDMLEQRTGRGWRQGNQYANVDVHFYVTAETFDAYMWQTVQRKQTWIARIMQADPTVRIIEELPDDNVMTYAAIKAAATGDERMVTLNELEARKDQLLRLRVGWQRENYERTRFVDETEAVLDALLSQAMVHAKVPAMVQNLSDEATVQLCYDLASVIQTNHYDHYRSGPTVRGDHGVARFSFSEGRLRVETRGDSVVIDVPGSIRRASNSKRLEWAQGFMVEIVTQWAATAEQIAIRAEKRRIEASKIAVDLQFEYSQELSEVTDQADLLRTELEEEYADTVTTEAEEVAA